MSRMRRPSANESAGSNDSSPNPSELDEEKRDILRGVLRQAGAKSTKEVVERLTAAIEPLMAEFRQAASQGTRRERHDVLRELLRLAGADDPPVAVIRKRITELEPTDLADAEERARATMTDHVRMMVDAGYYDGDPELIGHIFWASLHGVVVLHLAGKLDGEVDLDTLLAEMGRVLRNAYLVRTPVSA